MGIDLHFPNKAHIKKDYPASIFSSKPDQLWTAQQIVDVTDGEWLVPPPEGWFVQSVASRFIDVKRSALIAPVLFMPTPSFWDSSERPAELPQKIGAIAVKERRTDVPPTLPQLKISDPAAAVVELGVAARRRFQGKTIGITGSSGKSTTNSMLKHVLIDSMRVFQTYANQNITLIPTIFASVHQDAAFALIEIASSAFELSRGPITYDIPPDIAIVTSISAAHIARHGSMEGIVAVKSKIFCGMHPGGYAILNRDMPYYDVFESKAKAAQLNIISFGTHPDATIRMPELKSGNEFVVDGKKYVLECVVPAIQLYDALAAVGVSITSGFSIDKALQRLKDFKPISGRGNIIEVERNGKKLKLLNSTFNANIGSMTGDLDYLKSIATEPNHRVAVLGDITELGNESIERHRELAPAVIGTEADRVILCGEFMQYLRDEIKDQVNVTYFPTLENLIDGIDDCLKDGDIVLVKSSHSTHLNNLVKYLVTGVRVSN